MMEDIEMRKKGVATLVWPQAGPVEGGSISHKVCGHKEAKADESAGA